MQPRLQEVGVRLKVTEVMYTWSPVGVKNKMKTTGVEARGGKRKGRLSSSLSNREKFIPQEQNRRLLWLVDLGIGLLV